MKYTLEGEESERLKFRLLKNDDFNVCVEFFEDIEICRFLGVDKIETPFKRTEFWSEMTFDRYKNDLGGATILVEKNTGEIIGNCGLIVREVDGKKEIEIAYSILPKHRRKGFASEATRKCKDFAFENKFSESLISIIHTENSNSASVAISNGMVKDCVTEYKGMLVNIYRIDKPDWEKEKAKEQLIKNISL